MQKFPPTNRQVSLGALLDIDWDNTALAAFGPQLLNGEVRFGGAGRATESSHRELSFLASRGTLVSRVLASRAGERCASAGRSARSRAKEAGSNRPCMPAHAIETRPTSTACRRIPPPIAPKGFPDLLDGHF